MAQKPWTVQARVSDLGSLEDRLYLAVNGYGLASIQLPRAAGSAPEFRYFYDPLLFRYRTLTTLVPASGWLTCHLYYNRLLNLADAGELPIQGLSLLELHPQNGIYRQIRTPFQVAHRGWECVGFAPLSGQEFLLEWKLSEPERTLFEYTRWFPAAAAEKPAARQDFRQAWEPRPLPGKLPEELEPLVRELLGPSGEKLSLFLAVRTAGQPLCRRYARRSSSRGEEESRLLTAHAFLDGERRLLLAADGLLLATGPGGGGPGGSADPGDPGGAPTARRLPALPAGFQYTDLFALQGLLFAVWEQADFTSTGAAGIFISGEL